MANSAQARKRARQSEEARQRNASQRSALRTEVKKVRKAVSAGDKLVAQQVFQSAKAIIDRIADKKVVHKNTAARYKSNLSSAVKAMS